MAQSRNWHNGIFKTSGLAFDYSPVTDYANQPELNIGMMDIVCRHCQALLYPDEPKGMCCNGGKVKLEPLIEPPPSLQSLLNGQSQQSKEFLGKIRTYNSVFSMTCFGANVTREYGYMPTFKVQG